MSTFAVSPRQVTSLAPIPDADRIELATVEGFQAVVGKGAYVPGAWVLYIPEQSILPENIIADLGLEGRLSGKAKNRVKPVRLRGCLSQGLLMPLPEWAEPDPTADYAEQLGITKWAPVVPAHMAGTMVPAPDLMRWCEVENIRKLRMQDAETGAWFDPLDGLTVSVTEKIHGTCFIATMTRDGDVMVASKGVAGRACSLLEDANNLYWRAYHAHGLADVLRDVLAEFPAVQSASVYGEVYGHKVQDLGYGVPGGAFAAFDVRAGHEWLSRDHLVAACAGRCAVVPELYHGPYDHASVWALADGENVAGEPGAHVREGVVARPVPGRLHGGERLIAKFVSEGYLFRGGGTEYE